MPLSFATVERLLAGAADAKVYSREPALAIVQQLTWRGSSEFTGLAPQQIVNEWVKGPTSFIDAQPRTTVDETAVASISETAATESPRIQCHSFLSNTGGRTSFADIEVSTDDDLIEAGYPFYSSTEDPGLAQQSVRNILERIRRKSNRP